MFLGFINFYYCFIWGFYKITLLFTSILKIAKLLDKSASIIIVINANKIVGSDLLKIILPKSKKIKLTKSKKLDKSINLTNLFDLKIKVLTLKLQNF